MRRGVARFGVGHWKDILLHFDFNVRSELAAGQCWGVAAVCADLNEEPNDVCVPPPILVIVQNRTVVNLKDKWRNMLRAGTTGM